MIKKILLLFAILSSLSYAKTYSLYLASTKYIDVAKEYYEDIRFHTPDFYDVVIRTHIKKNYSVIIRKIPTIEKAKKIQKLLQAQKKYPDAYIKRFYKEPKYTVIKIEEEVKTKKIVEEPYNHDVEDTNEYITASIMYNTNQYQKAYDKFYKLFLKNNYNLNINYFLAKSAFNLKKYDEATAAFERVLILKPDFNQARYDYARILYKLKQNEESKKEFNKLLKSNIDNDTKKKIEDYLKILNTKKKRKKISANIMFGVGRSSNVNNGLSSALYRLPGLNNILVEGEEPIADNSHLEMINLNFFNYFEKLPIRVKNSFYAFNKNYFNEKDENITVFSYKPALDYFDNKNNRMYSLELAADKINRKTDEDFYAFAISPKFITKDFTTYLKYQKILYTRDEDQDKDFEKIQMYAKINLFKNLNYYTNLYKNIQLNDLRTDIDKYTIENGLSLFYNIDEKNRVNLNYQFDYSKYKYENLGFNSLRKDKKHFFEISMSHNFKKNSILFVNVSYMNNDSNQDAYIYSEKAIGLNYLKAFIW
ncbi:MAG: hypothetical protein C0625_13185 [Arcobacter sp.]|nr:MAG: hypothetical protein C0625_13185 [Arcobacter sp.]